MKLSILDARRPDERAEWVRLWESSAERDVFAHPTYAEQFAGEGDDVLCAVGLWDDGGVLFPLLLRPIDRLPWASGAPSRDATTPYGYGGPTRLREPAVEQEAAFFSELESQLRAKQVVAAFSRLSLFPGLAAIPPNWKVTEVAPNVVCSLHRPPEEQWREYAHKVRKNVNRARQHGLRCEIDLEGRRLDDFLAVYESTMARRGASDSYLFPRTFFEKLLTIPSACVYFHVLAGDRVVSTELVLRSRRHLYSFLGGTLSDAFELRANDLLKHEVIGWGHAEGLEAFVLGGGFTPGDGIFQYKKAFAPDGVVPFRTASLVLLPSECASLVERRTAWAAERGESWSPRETYFPPYRS